MITKQIAKLSLGIMTASLLSASAQGAAMLEEVVVTAQKRAQNVQDVPISITAISGSELDDRGAISLVDVGNFAPNVQLDQGAFLAGSSQVMTAYIRGIGQRDIASGLEPGVGVYVDGVFLSRSTGANVDLLDVERVEVLKGPQGTLFGRNTIGGAVSVVTRKPDEVLGGKLKASIGERDLVDIKGTIDIPISDSLLSQFSFSRTKQDGYQKILPFPGDPGSSDEAALVAGFGLNDLGPRDTRGGQDNYSLRGKLLWKVNDDTEVTFSVDYARADEEAGAFSLVDDGIVAGPTDLTYAAVYNACVALPEAVVNASPLASICGPRSLADSTLPALAAESPATRLLIAEGVFDTGDIDTTYGNGANTSDVEITGLSLTLDSDLGWGSLKTITSYRTTDSLIVNDIDGTPVTFATTAFNMDHEQWSQEFQLNVDLLEDKLKTVTGLYYFHEESSNRGGASIAEGLGSFFGPYTTDVDSYAAYFNANYAFTDQFSMTFGMRYTQDEKAFNIGQRDWNLSTIKLGLSNPADYPTDDLTLIAAPGETNEDYEDTSFRLGTEYLVNPNVMVYASFSQGFKSGGIATRLSAPTVGNQPLTFDPETAETWEVGVKSQILDNRMQVNAALFTTEYEDMQITYSVGISPFFDNAGQSTIKGAELEIQARPHEAILISAGVGYLKAEYDELDDNIINNTPIGLNNMLVNVPEWSGNLSLDWDMFPFADGMVKLHADYLYKDKMARDSENTPLAIADSYEIVNASFSWRTADEAITLSVWGNNLTDERYITSTSFVPAVGVPGNSYNSPRQYGLTMTYNF